jgi:hypothetical protein
VLTNLLTPMHIAILMAVLLLIVGPTPSPNGSVPCLHTSWDRPSRSDYVSADEAQFGFDEILQQMSGLRPAGEAAGIEQGTREYVESVRGARLAVRGAAE